MFRCEVCGSVTPPGASVNRITVESREVEYPRREKVHWQPPKAGGSGKWVDDPGGRGTAIVREVRACSSCAAQVREARPPPVVA